MDTKSYDELAKEEFERHHELYSRLAIGDVVDAAVKLATEKLEARIAKLEKCVARLDGEMGIHRPLT